MNSVKVYSETFPAIFSRRSREATAASSHLFTPQALGSLPVSGPLIFCNPNPFHSPNPFLPLISPVYCLRRDIMSTKFTSGLFSPPPQDRFPNTFPEPLFKLLSRFFAPNLNLYLALLLPVNIFLILWWDWLFLTRSSFTGMTDKGKPFERMGRKTTDLSNGGWVAELRSRISLAHSFEVKTGLFFMRNPGAIRRSIMNIPRSLIIRHTDLDPSYIPLAYRRQVLERDKKSCHFCEQPTEYLCHDLVKCRGGKTVPDNLLTSCVLCRREKGELTAAEYFEVKLKEENIFKEVTMLVRVTFSDPRRPPIEGEVEDYARAGPNTKAFWIRSVGNGKRSLIFTGPEMVIEELGGKTKGEKG